MPRRQGQIKEIEPGKKYKVIIFLGEVNGKNKYKSKTVRGTYRQAESQLHKMLSKRDEFSPHAMARKPLEVYAEHYLKAQEARIRGNSYRKIQSHIRTRIIPALGSHKLEKLQAKHVTRWLESLNRELSPETTRNVYATLKAMLNAAVSEEVLIKSPCPVRAKLPAKRKKEPKALSKDQLTAVLSHCEGQDLALLTLLASAGLRPCEARPLFWSDLDVATGQLSVTKSADTQTDVVSTPKTDLSFRRVTLPASTLELMQGLPKESELMFHNGFGDIVRHSSLDWRFKQAAKKAAITGYSVYCLRHTHITQLLLEGTPVTVVADRVGDRPERILSTYSHVIQGADVLAAERWDIAINSAQRVVN